MNINNCAYPRPCMIRNKAHTKKAIFLGWGLRSDIIDTDTGIQGVMNDTVAIVECEDGSVRTVHPESIIFCDSLFKFDELLNDRDNYQSAAKDAVQMCRDRVTLPYVPQTMSGCSHSCSFTQNYYWDDDTRDK